MASVDWAALARDIVKAVGGESNVSAVTHCATRLRFQLKDGAKADRAGIESMKGVITVVESGGQFQVVIGNNVPKVYAELGALASQESGGGAVGGNLFNKFIAMISAIFSPMLWPLAGTGLLKAFLAMAAQFGWLDPKGQDFTILNAAADSLFYFLPLFLAVTASRRFKANTFTSMAIAGALVYPSIVALNTAGEPVHFFGVPVVMFSYVSSVIPVIVAVAAQAQVEKFLNRVLPDWLRNFTTPLLTVALMVPLVLLTIGPVSTYLGKGISLAISSLWTVFPPVGPAIGGALMGSMWQVFVLFGMHWGFVPIFVNDLSTLGYAVMMGPLPAAVLAQAAATLAVMLKSRNHDLKELAGPAALSGFLAGITEPAIYGVTLRLKKPFVYACVAGAIGGAIAASGGAAAQSFVFPSVLALPAFAGVGNFGLLLIGTGLAIVLGFGLTWFLGFDDPKNPIDEEPAAPAAATGSGLEIVAPVAGELVELAGVGDKVFASGALGSGLGIIPSDGIVRAPFDGTVVTAMDSHHAYGLLSTAGVELLIHIGIDTVQLGGKHFTPRVKTGDTVRAGDPLVEVDLAAVLAAGFDTTTILAVTNSAAFTTVTPAASGPVSLGDPVLSVVR